MISQQLNNVSAVWEHSDDRNNVIKLKADIHRNIALSLKNHIKDYSGYHIKDYGSYVFGVGVSDLGRTNKFKYGLQFNLNI